MSYVVKVSNQTAIRLRVPCDRCGADSQTPCRNGSGATVSVHTARRLAVISTGKI